MEEKKKEHIIELYELWNTIKTRFNIVDPFPKSFRLSRKVIPTISLDACQLEYIDLSDDTQVNSGGSSNYQELKPPEGFLYHIVGLLVDIPDAVGSAAGAHTLYLLMGGETTELKGTIVSASANTGTDITYAGRYGFLATTISPSALSYQKESIRDVVASNTYPVVFRYTNSLDVNQTGNRVIKVLVEKSPEGDL